MRTTKLIGTVAVVAMALVAAGCGIPGPETGPSGVTNPPEDTEPSETTPSQVLFINEFMADNDTTIADPDGAGGFPDWIELYNAGESDIDLGGMHLTDDLANPTRWQVPAGVVIPAGGHLLFWADNDEEQGDTHTNFQLDRDGESVGLFDTASNDYAEIDTVSFDGQTADVSYGRSTDGSDSWQSFAEPTPGQSNGSAQE